jgi:hypothetical protein
MIRRWRSLTRREVPHGTLHAQEALGGWMLGTAWLLLGLWLVEQGARSLVPAALLLGVVALIAWRHVEWLHGLAPVAVGAALLGPLLSPFGVRGLDAAADLLIAGVAIVAAVRAVAVHRRLLPPTPFDRLVPALVIVQALAIVPLGGEAESPRPLMHCLTAVVVMYATATIAARRGGARWAWSAFPIAATLVGIHVLAAALHGPDALAAAGRRADAAWATHGGLLAALACALPVTAGLMFDAGHGWARRAAAAAALLGVTSLALHAGWGTHPAGAPAERVTQPLSFITLAIHCVAFAAFARTAWGVGRARPAERLRWWLLAGTFAFAAGLELGVDVLATPVAGLLIGAGAGLAAGVARADARRAAAGEFADAHDAPGALAEAA